MTAKRRPQSPRNIELAKIHMAAGALGLIKQGEDSAYRDMLWSLARVRSAKDLDTAGRQRVIKHLRSCGWVDTSPTKRPATGNRQAGYIRHLWECLHRTGQLEDGTERALRVYVEHQTKPYHPQKVGYSAPELLPSRVAQRVIEHLKHWCKRTETPTE